MLEHEIANLVMQYCDTCTSLGDCVLPAPGWVPVPPEEAKEMYGEEAPWSWRQCNHFATAVSEKQQNAAMKGKWQERTLDSFKVTPENRDAYNAAKEYAKTLNPFTKDGLMFTGAVGTGKTHLAAGILKTAYKRSLDGVLISVPDLLNEIRNGFNNKGPSIEDKLKDKFLVILDDLGAENITDWVRENLFTLINHRYENQKPLIITTNCTPAQLTERIGERTTDRLREMCKVVTVGGKSWRRRNDKI